MKTLKTYEKFLLENKIDDKELLFFMDKILSLPTSEILELRDDMEKMIKTENVNESVSSFLKNIKTKFDNWLDDRLFKFLINRKKNFYVEIIDKLNLFDLTNLDDVFESYPGFELGSMYLAGGMDEADDAGAGWRNILEKEFEIENPGTKNSELNKVEIENKNIQPSYVVDSEHLFMILDDESKLNMYDKPALLNPVRMEVDRNIDEEFPEAIRKMKSPDFEPTEDQNPIDFFRKTFSKTIEPNDEHLLRISDVVFLGMDSTAGAGTYAEMELLSLIRKPLFAWLVNSHENKPGNFKFWNIPHLSKIARTTDDMKILVKTILRYT